MPVLGLILAGGDARRMGGGDKARLDLAGEPLIAHVRRRLAPQVDELAISAGRDYGTGLAFIPDLPGGVKGPLAGLAAAVAWLEAQQRRQISAIATAPVDTPFLPRDLVARLAAAGGQAVAETPQGLQPAFGYWPLAALEAARPLFEQSRGAAMAALIDATNAARVRFEDERAFLNINHPDDLAKAEAQLAARRSPG